MSSNIKSKVNSRGEKFILKSKRPKKELSISQSEAHNVYRKKKRIADRIDLMSSEKSLNPMVLLYLDGHGTVKAAGTPGLRREILNISRDAMCKYVEDNSLITTDSPKSCEDVYQVQEIRSDLVDPDALEEIKQGTWSCKELRKLVLNMVLPRTADIDKKGKRKWKVARVRDFWLKAEKPLFWPPHIPFVSPSARINQPSEDDYDEEEFDDKTERSRKILNKKELIEIALSYGEYVHEFTGNEKNEETTQSFGQGRQEKTNRDANVGKDTYTSEEDKRSDESEKREDFENKFVDNEAALNNIKEDEREEDTQLVNLQQMRDMYEKREIACIVRAMLKDPLKYVETAYELLDLADTHQHPITKNLKSHEKTSWAFHMITTQVVLETFSTL
ncbi:uncharacterized protein LOC124455265 [Xenia sp. Carnegie-2017]|uniref:uncharacterized protein LOC124455265 n=1 Tax=Xenia sp. Carnegie-2017 TaxID=2897299 RepID=UPI001F03BC0D|nr:uncharacterized protein LOC124455265 [Xenia sp. Carnegie-2017]